MLEQAATAHNLDDLASLFRKALSDELGAPAGDLRGRQVQVKNHDERDLVDALLYAIRLENMDEYSKTAKAIRRALKTIVEQQRRHRETNEALDSQRRAIAGLLEKGRSAREVLALFRITPEALAEAFFNSSMKSLDARIYYKKMTEVVDLLFKDGRSIREMAEKFGGDNADDFISIASDLGMHKEISIYEDEQNAD